MSSPRLSMAIVMIALTALTPMPTQSETKTVQKGPNVRLSCELKAQQTEDDIKVCSERKWSVKYGVDAKGTDQQKCCALMNHLCAYDAYNEAECNSVADDQAKKKARDGKLAHCQNVLGVTWTETLCDTGSGPIFDDRNVNCGQYKKYLDCISFSGGLAANALFVVSTLIVSILVLL